MIRESKVYKVLCGVHVVFFTSLLGFGLTYLSASILLLPSLYGVFYIGKEIFYGQFDINNSIIKTFWSAFKKGVALLKFLPFQLIIVVNGISVLMNTYNALMGYFSMVVIAFLITYLIYACHYYTFVEQEVHYTDVFVYMFYNPLYLCMLFILSLLALVFINGNVLVLLLFCGSTFIFVIECFLVLHVLFYKKTLGILEEEDELLQRLDCYKETLGIKKEPKKKSFKI